MRLIISNQLPLWSLVSFRCKLVASECFLLLTGGNADDDRCHIASSFSSICLHSEIKNTNDRYLLYFTSVGL